MVLEVYAGVKVCQLNVYLKVSLHDHIYVKSASHFLCDHRM